MFDDRLGNIAVHWFLAHVSMTLPPSAVYLPVTIDAPFQPRAFQSCHPALGQRKVARLAQLPGIAFPRSRLDIKPEALHDDLMLLDIIQKFAELLLDRFTRYTGRLAACAGEHVRIDIRISGLPSRFVRREKVGIYLSSL